MTDVPKFYPLDLDEITRNHLYFTINAMQPYYFVAESFTSAKEMVERYCAKMERPFQARYDAKKKEIIVDREVVMRKEIAENGPLF